MKEKPQDMEALIAQLPLHEQEKLMEQVAEYRAALEREKCQESFMAFVKKMWPGFIHGRHHAVLAKAIEQIASGEIKRLAISLPPRHTKSEMFSYMCPAWFLGKFPGKKVMQASNTGELAVGFGRKVRNLVMSEQYHEVFPDTRIRQDSKSAGRWAVNEHGEYFAIGVGGTMTGRGADLVIIDDPHTEGEATLAAHDPSIYDKAYEWYTSGPRQRLQPGGAIIIVACMTGETKVLMADGSEKELRSINVQDCVATYEDGAIATAKVLNWKSQGFDDILKITTTSGKIVRANKRHPFLVEQNGVREWIKVKDLKVGQHLIGVVQQMDAQGQDTPRGCAAPATKTKHGQKERPDQHQKQRQEQPPSDRQTTQTQLVTGASGLEWSAQPRDAASQQEPKDFATLATPARRGLKEKIATLPKRFVTTVLNQGTALLLAITKKCCLIKTDAVQFANSFQATATLGFVKKGNSALTTATAQERSGDSCATTATWQLGTQKQSQPCLVPPSTYEVTLDAIASIELDGHEEVFDVEIDRTENFIANGLVSHNTRWGETDLIGRVLKDAAERNKPDEWRVIEFPAILPSGNPLWPEFWPLDQLQALKEELAPMKWNAQYQQKPTGEEGALIKRDWWNVWEQDDPPRCEFIIQAWDTAFTKNERSDYSACTTWGVFFLNEDPNNPNIILLDAFQKRMEFPELKEKARAHYLEWEPDDCIIEAKAAGASLIQELNQSDDMFVRGYTPSRGTRQQSNDKIARMNSVSPIFQGGKVWAPDTRWARELIDQMASFPNAAHDDLCLAGGTLIEMADGSLQAIETVQVGQTVKTPLGPKQVVAAGPTGVKPVFQICAGGNTLEATAGHRISTTKGWVSIDIIKMSDTVKMSQTKGAFLWLSPQKMVLSLSRLCSMAASTTVTQMQKLTRTRGITRSAVGAGSCTVTSGNFTTDQYQMGATFTTKMATGATTQLKTWSACQHPSITKSTPSTPLNFKKPPNELLTLKKFKDLLLSGTEAKKVELGTEKTRQNTLSPVEQRELLGRNHFKSEERIHSNWSALFAKSRLMRYLSRLNFAQMRARVETAKETNEQKLVYNLSVDGARCYYANGFLVHNCDTAVMAITRFRQGGFLRLESDAQDEPQSFRRKAAFY